MYIILILAYVHDITYVNIRHTTKVTEMNVGCVKHVGIVEQKLKDCWLLQSNLKV